MICSELWWRMPRGGASTGERLGEWAGQGRHGARILGRGNFRSYVQTWEHSMFRELLEGHSQGGAGMTRMEARPGQSWTVKTLVDSAQDFGLQEWWEVPAGLNTRKPRQVGARLAAGDRGVWVRGGSLQ